MDQSARNELHQLKVQQLEVESSSWASTQRSLSLLRESEQVASETSIKLVEQREKLENASKNLDVIENSLKDNQKNINKMKGVLTRLRSFFSMKKNSPITPNNGETYPRLKSGSHPAGIDDETGSPSPTLEELEPHDESGDSVNSEVDAVDINLQEISIQLTSLKKIAQDMGEELTVQNHILDEIHEKAMRTNATIEQQDKQLEKLIK